MHAPSLHSSPNASSPSTFWCNRTSAELSVECSTIEWTETQAPFHKVATIRSLPEHRPLGSVNRVRRVVYEEISRARHQMNGVPPREPTPGETFEI